MRRDLIIKVCGMRDADNIKDVAKLVPDYMGFIFWQHTPRSATAMPESNTSLLAASTKPVGVFVNEDVDTIIATCRAYSISTVQLHGQESADICSQLKSHGLHVWKAFGLDTTFDFSTLNPYTDSVDMFVFDTKTPRAGGSGVRFDWSILDSYTGPVPYLLSGGINPDSVDDIIAASNHPYMAGIDLNSRFETAPGIKDSKKLTNFVNSLTK